MKLQDGELYFDFNETVVLVTKSPSDQFFKGHSVRDGRFMGWYSEMGYSVDGGAACNLFCEYDGTKTIVLVQETNNANSSS